MKSNLLILCLILGLNSFEQERNLFFRACNIGDRVSTLDDRFYCHEFDGSFSHDIKNCTTHQLQFFPSKADSVEFIFMRFDAVLVISNDKDLVSKIWLMKSYPKETLDNSFDIMQNDFEKIADYLNTRLNQKGEPTVEKIIAGGNTTELKWVNDSTIYRLTKSVHKNKKSKFVNSISMQIY